jgi:putative phosphoribosyl transferase
MAGFNSRREAGIALAGKLQQLGVPEPIVYALPRGGLPVAAEVANRLNAPLDVILVRKLGAPGHSELAIGAVADGAAPAVVLHDDILRNLGVGADFVERAKTEALKEIDRRRAALAHVRVPLSPEGRVVIIVDDGLATGATMEAAVASMRKAKAKRVIVAVPTAPIDTAARFRALADEFIALETPDSFWSVGARYRRFPQLTDADVIDILTQFHKRQTPDLSASEAH